MDAAAPRQMRFPRDRSTHRLQSQLQAVVYRRGQEPMDKLSVISASPAFRMLERGALLTIADAAEFQRVETTTDGCLFRYGDSASALYLIVPSNSGGDGPVLQIGFGARASERAAVGFRLTEGEIAGDVEFLLAGLTERLPPRICSARILRDATVLAIPARVVAGIAQTETVFRRSIVRQATQRLAEIASIQAERKAMHPEVRFANGLLSQLDDFGHVAGNKGIFDRRLKQQDLADNLGISRRLLSLRFSDWSARGLLETVPITLPDIARVERIAGLSLPNIGQKLRSAIEDIEDQIAKGLLAKASQTATDVLSILPGNPLAAYQLALVSVRLGAAKQAKAIMAAPAFRWTGAIGDVKERLRVAWRQSLSWRAGDDEDDWTIEQDQDAVLAARLHILAIDVGALHARLEKDLIEACPKGSRLQREQAHKAARIYREVHEASPNYYCAVNAATLSKLAGNEDEARALAVEARRLALAGERTYWTLATLGEADLVLGDGQAAVEGFHAAAAAPDVDLAKTTSTRRQLALIANIGAAETSSALAALDIGDPVFFSGHLMAAGDGSPEELMTAERLLAAHLERWLTNRRVPAVHMSLACGADIIFAELALKAGIPLNVTLPFSVAHFCKLSVAIGNGPGIKTDWEARYYACLDEAATITELWKHEIPKGEQDAHFLNANRHIAGETIFAAAALMMRPTMLAVVHPKTAVGKAGTKTALAEFARHGFRVDVIDAPLARRPVPTAARGIDPFAPVIFAFARSQQDNAGARRMLEELGFGIRVLKDRRVAGHFLPSSFEEAHFMSLRASASATEAGASVRVICDFGPILGKDGAPNIDDMLKLDAAGDLTAVAVGDVFATANLVMHELALGGDPGRYSAVNVSIESSEDGRDVVLRGARQIYKVREA